MKFAALFQGMGAAKKQPGLSTELKEITMASVLNLNTAPKHKTQPEAASVHWFQERVRTARSGIITEPTVITPAMAEVILGSNDGNRNLRVTKVAQYTSDMIGGRWVMNGETIIISEDGQLNDGQHRLRAVIESGVPQQFLIVFGVPRATRTTLDQGAARCAADYLQMDGIANPALLAGTARLVMAYERSNGLNLNPAGSITNAEVLARAGSDGALHEAAHFADTGRKFTKGFLIPSIIGAAFYILSDVHPGDAQEYMGQVVFGENIRRGMPAFAVRNALNNLEGAAKAGRTEIVFRGWNAFRQNRPLTLAKSFGSFPALV